MKGKVSVERFIILKKSRFYQFVLNMTETCWPYFQLLNKRLFISMKQEDLSPQEKHKIWMQNSGYLYDRLMIQKLKWPSLTFQWLPYKQQTAQTIKYRFIYGSHSSGTQPTQHLYIGQVQFPHLKSINEGPSQQSAIPSKMKNIFRFNHQSQINKARHKEDNADLIACRMDNAPIAVFQMGSEYPLMLLSEEMGEGFALEWKAQGLVSGDFEGNIRVWRDVETQPVLFTYESSVEDTKWVDSNVIVSVGDNGYMNFWDIRQNNSIVQSVLTTSQQKRQVYCVAVNPYRNNTILTGGQDQSVRIWDTRNLGSRLHKFDDHEDSIVTLDWSPLKPNIFASGSLDTKVKIWDLMRVGFEIPKDLGGTDELLFTHEGHQGAVNDISWNPHAMLLGSCEEDKNTIQFYEMSNYIHEFEYTEDVEFLREQCFG